MEISFIDSRRLANPLYIDMRSPAEFREDHIPGALNQKRSAAKLRDNF